MLIDIPDSLGAQLADYRKPRLGDNGLDLLLAVCDLYVDTANGRHDHYRDPGFSDPCCSSSRRAHPAGTDDGSESFAIVHGI